MADQTAPTQTRHPWRATFRTAFAALIGLAAILPLVFDTLGISHLKWVAAAVAICAGITRVLAMPTVDAWLRDFLPWLAAEPRSHR